MTGKSSLFRGVTLFRPTLKWRAQISAGGKTTSLGDHDTEEDAARAFDRAAINKAGLNARTNFDVSDYLDEVEDLQKMSQTELVAMLRSRARKSGTQTSHFRGVSLLKQTGKWHAQINVGGKQVHLGFFATEEAAARAYDRAAINKGARDGGKIITNYGIDDYAAELELLRRLSQEDLVAALASESRRKQTMEMLSEGFAGTKPEQVFGQAFGLQPGALPAPETPALAELRAKAERAQPKPTEKNQLYANFGRKREDAPAPTPEQVAAAQARREAAARHQEELAEARRQRARLTMRPMHSGGLHSRADSPTRDGGVTPIPTPAASPMKPSRGRGREGTPEQGLPGDELPASSPFMRAARSRRKRPAFIAQRFLKYDHDEDSNLTSATAAPVGSDSEDEAASHSGAAGAAREYSDDLEMRFLQANKPRTKRQEALMARKVREGRVPLLQPPDRDGSPGPPPVPTPAPKARRPSFPASPMRHGGLKNGLVEAVAAAAAGSSMYVAPGDAALAAAPSEMPTPSDSGSQTRDHTGHRLKRTLSLDADADEAAALKRLGKNRRTRLQPSRAL